MTEPISKPLPVIAACTLTGGTYLWYDGEWWYDKDGQRRHHGPLTNEAAKAIAEANWAARTKASNEH